MPYLVGLSVMNKLITKEMNSATCTVGALEIQSDWHKDVIELQIGNFIHFSICIILTRLYA